MNSNFFNINTGAIVVSERKVKRVQYTWDCPTCGAEMSSSRKPEIEFDYLCQDCVKCDRRFSKFRADFLMRYSRFSNAKVVGIIENKEYWYDYDDGTQLPIKAIRLLAEDGNTYAIKANRDGDLVIEKAS